MLLDRQVLEIVALAGAAVAVLALLCCLLCLRRLGRLRRTASMLAADGREESFVDAAARQVAAVRALSAEVDSLRTEVEGLTDRSARAVQHVSVVRYDAFHEMGGRMSFSAALLDDLGDGVVITAINGRHETRTWAKFVTGGSGDQTLSPEEEQAVAHARQAVSRRAVPAAR